MKTKMSLRRSKKAILTANLSKIKKWRKKRTRKSRTWTKATTIEFQEKLKTSICLAALTLSLKMKMATITFISVNKKTKVKLRTMMKISRSISCAMKKKIKVTMNKCNKNSTSKLARLPYRWSPTRLLRQACLT